MRERRLSRLRLERHAGMDKERRKGAADVHGPESGLLSISKDVVEREGCTKVKLLGDLKVHPGTHMEPKD
jgi:hypothetical protein